MRKVRWLHSKYSFFLSFFLFLLPSAVRMLKCSCKSKVISLKCILSFKYEYSNINAYNRWMWFVHILPVPKFWLHIHYSLRLLWPDSHQLVWSRSSCSFLWCSAWPHFHYPCDVEIWNSQISERKRVRRKRWLHHNKIPSCPVENEQWNGYIYLEMFFPWMRIVKKLFLCTAL